MSSPEFPSFSAEEAMLRSDLIDVFQDNAFNMGVVQDYDRIDARTLFILVGSAKIGTRTFPVEVWSFGETQLGSAYLLIAEEEMYSLWPNTSIDVKRGFPMSYEDYKNMRVWLRETQWDKAASDERAKERTDIEMRRAAEQAARYDHS